MCVKIGFLSSNSVDRSGLFTMVQINILQSHYVDFICKKMVLFSYSLDFG